MKKILIISVLSFVVGIINASPLKKDTAKQRKFEELRNQILIEKLSLTEQEQKDFLPLYTDYKEKEQEINKQIRRTVKSSQKEGLTEKEANVVLEKLKKLNLEKANLFSSYIDKFKTVLPATKVVKLYAVEREIRKILMNKIKERKGN